MGHIAIPRLVIAGASSGVGKTTITAGLIKAWHAQGLRVQPFKVGPDYIDPTYHTLASGRPCRTLDIWMVPLERLGPLFASAVRGADLAVIEGVMGLYDGFDYSSEAGSTAQVAKAFRAPVVLVLDAGKMARSAGALALGYQKFDADLPLAGFIVNGVGSESHGRGVAQAIKTATGLPVFGWLPRQEALRIPERHLGLVPTLEPWGSRAFLKAAADLVSEHLDLEGLWAAASRAPPLKIRIPRAKGPSAFPFLLPRGHPPSFHGGPRIAVAKDSAFSFLYEDNLDLLQGAGAEVVFFSPLKDPGLPEGTAGVILSGGFPEVYAEALAANRGFFNALKKAFRAGLPIYAECGGLMILTKAIVTRGGEAYPMAGLLPGRSIMTERLTLGYRIARAAGDSWLFRSGEVVRSHEFHYSLWEGRPSFADLPPAYVLLPPSGEGKPRPEGARLGSLLASYLHLHFGSKPELAARFVAAARRAGESLGRRGVVGGR